MNATIKQSAAIAIFLSTLFSCRKADPVTPPVTENKEGTVKLEIFNKVGLVDLDIYGAWYKNQNDDSFQVTTFNYYLSNIKFNNVNGSSFAEPESYHLAEEAKPSSLSFDIAKVPAGVYSSMTFTIGVDSLRNVSGAQTGALDQSLGMFWGWKSGYIMFKLEGVSPQSTQTGNVFMLHAGGFSGTYNVLKTVTLNFPEAITVNGDVNHIHLEANVQKALGSPNPVKFSETSVIMSEGPKAKALADNYQNMFSIVYAGK